MKKQVPKTKQSILKNDNKENVIQKNRESHKFLFDMIGRIFRD